MTSLYQVVKSSYGNKKADENIRNQGYIRDSDLSSDEYVTYFHPEQKKLVFSVAGTHSINDWGVDAYLAAGKLKQTDRYQRAHKAVRDAKEKYGVKEATIAGHSLGGAIASYIGSKDDKVLTYNTGYALGQKTKGESYRTSGDIISIAGIGGKHVNTLEKKTSTKDNFIQSSLSMINPLLGLLYGGFTSHKDDNLKDQPIFV